MNVLVLCYHRVTPALADPWGLCVTPEHFAEQMAVLRRDTQPLPLLELAAAAARNDGPARAVAVTFDDGYIDNLTAAAPVLARHAIPATVFVATGYVASAREFWWDIVQDVFLARDTLPATLTLELDGTTRTWTLAPDERLDRAAAERVRGWRAGQPPPTTRHAVYLDVWGRLRPLAEEARMVAIDRLVAWADTCGPARNDTDAGRSANRAMTPGELAAIAGSGLVALGAHTVTHPLLASLTAADQTREIADSRATLAALTGRPVTTLAYPYGDHDAGTRAAAQAAGITVACAGGTRSVTPASDPLCVPRCGVDDWDGAAFARHLEAWFRS